MPTTVAASRAAAARHDHPLVQERVRLLQEYRERLLAELAGLDRDLGRRDEGPHPAA